MIFFFDVDRFTLYKEGTPLGQWFTSIPAKSVAQVWIDLAVKPQWIDPMTVVMGNFEIKNRLPGFAG